MEKRSLHFTDLHVRRMYGEMHEGLRAQDLCGGLNVVYGPNAAGKSTLGRAVKHVLWPDQGDGQSIVEAFFRLDGTSWRVDLEADRARFERDGRPSDRPVLPCSDTSSRYHLYLHELLQASEEASKPFARAIMQEASGGIDVGEARAALGFKEVRPSSGKLTREAEEAWQQLKEARAAQDALRDDQRRLKRLMEELDEARSARATAALLKLGIEYLDAREQAEQKRSLFESLPGALKEMSGDEPERLKSLRESATDAERDVADARSRIEEHASRLEASIVNAVGIEDGFLSGLQTRVQLLDEAERETKRIEKDLKSNRTERDDAWRRIGGALDEDRARELTLSEIGDLAEFVKEAEDAGAEEKVLRHQQEYYATGMEEAESDPDACGIGASILRSWLNARSADSGPKGSNILVGALIASAVVTAVLIALFMGLGALLIFGVGGIFGWLIFRRPRASDGAGDRGHYEKDFAATGVREPGEWTVDVVERRLDELYEEIKVHHDRAFRLSKLDEIRRDRERLEARKANIEERRADLTMRLGIDPDLEEEELYYAVEALRRWQDLHAKVCAREAELAEHSEQIRNLLEKIHTDLRPYGFESLEDAARAHQHLTTLSEAAAAYEQDRRELRQAEKDLKKAETAVERCIEETSELFERLGIDDDDDATLHRLAGRLEEYRQAEREHLTAQDREERARTALEARPDFTADLLTATSDELTILREDAETTANRADDLLEEIKGIEADVRKAESGHTVEERRARHERALEALHRKREEDFRTVAGWHLAEYIRTRTRDEQLPRVFHRARKMFGEITRQRYRLEFDDEAEEFAAYDNVLRRGRALGQLSSGTRVQLLLAVRLAFLEQQEHGVMVPLVLDETLANSDDRKAEEIIEAVMSICRTGRQVFYFTAQEDEVKRWKLILEEQTEVAYRFLPLSDAPSPEEIEPEALPSSVWNGDLPRPNGSSHSEYGRLLRVPRWDLRAPVGLLHAWYLIEDVEKLHGVLSSGFARWGSIQQIAGSDGIGLTEDDYRKAALCTRALETYQESWRVGRGRRVDRAVLLDSGAVTDTFIDRVSELCRELHGSGSALVQALRDSRVSGFRSSKADELEHYLLEHGYMDPDEPLSDDKIWASVVTDVGEEARELGMDLAQIRTFLERVAAPQLDRT